MAVSDLQLSIAAKDLVARDLKENNDLLSRQLADSESSRNAWYRNPYLLVTIGVLAGIWGAKK